MLSVHTQRRAVSSDDSVGRKGLQKDATSRRRALYLTLDGAVGKLLNTNILDIVNDVGDFYLVL